MTALQIIQSALRTLGVLASGEAPSAAESSDALLALNNMIDSWSTQSLLIPNQIREVFALVSGQQTYQMGVGASDFNTSRPMQIIRALIQLTNESPVVELPMEILTMEQYAGIILKGSTSVFPLSLYSDNANPMTTISVWPVPTDSSNNLVLYSWKPLVDIAAINTTLSLPPGYQRALIYNLAMELSSEYGRSPSQEVSGFALTSKAEIKRMNHRPRFLQVDDAVRATGGTYNWRTDSYNR